MLCRWAFCASLAESPPFPCASSKARPPSRSPGRSSEALTTSSASPCSSNA
ncbi:MAG: hypothetical protein ACRED4_08370 [Brevundimonas sp.]